MSDYLFAQPSFLSGVARVFDLFGTFAEYNTSPSRPVADFVALANDWGAVGDDIGAAMEAVQDEPVASAEDDHQAYPVVESVGP
jgi:hypothetical protein